MIEKQNEIDKKILDTILDHPHRLGHLVGKTKLTELHSYWIKYCFYPITYFEKNNHLKDMLNFFNNLGNTIDIQINDKQIERQQLTAEILYDLLKQKKRSLLGHRGSYKSTGIDLIGATIRLLFKPDERICIVRKDFTKASEILKTISNLMKQPEITNLFKIAHNIFPKSTIDRDNVITYNFKTTSTPEGNINAYGIHQDKVGKHFDLMLFDDFVSLEDKISKAEREKTKLHLEEDVNNVLDPDGQAIFIGTKWHEKDAWMICPKPIIFDCYTTKLMTEEQIQNKRKSTTNITFMANYELRHAKNDDCIFKEPKFDRWNYYGKGLGHIDKAYFGSDSNAVTFCEKKPDGRYSVIGFTFNENIKDKIDFIKDKWKKYRVGTIYTEDNDDKGLASDLLRQAGIPMTTYHESTNKHVKILSCLLENGFWDLIDFDPDTDAEYLNQILDYSENNDLVDCPDSLASMGRILITNKTSVFTSRWSNI